MSKYNSKCPLNCNKKGCGTHPCQRYADYQRGRADEQLDSIENAKTQAHEYLEALSKVKTETVIQFVKDVYDIELQSESYDDCVQELKEIMRMED